MIPSPVKFQLPARKGYIVGSWASKKFNVERVKGETLCLNENQGHILRELNACEDGLTASELADRLGLTHAGVIFLMKSLIASTLVERASIRGGGVLYYVTSNLREEPSEEVKQAIRQIEEKRGVKVETLGVKELAELSKNLKPDLRHSLIDWLLSGGR